jgi:hypothetical protein
LPLRHCADVDGAEGWSGKAADAAAVRAKLLALECVRSQLVALAGTQLDAPTLAVLMRALREPLCLALLQNSLVAAPAVFAAVCAVVAAAVVSEAGRDSLRGERARRA